MLGLTDVWSAIRKAAALRLTDVLSTLPFESTQHLYGTLVDMCQRDDALWQETEGAVQGITAILRKFTWVHKTTLKHMSNGTGVPFRLSVAADTLADRTDYQLTVSLHAAEMQR